MVLRPLLSDVRGSKKAYKLKEAFRNWFVQAKETGLEDPAKGKEGLYSFYQFVQTSGIPEMTKVISTLQNWQTEILNSFVYGY